MPKIITVESVTDGHPDKVCDQISDAILDELLKQDPNARTAVECLGSHGLLVIGGEVTSTADVDYVDVARKVYKQIGYDDDIEIINHVATQSPEIAQGVDTGGAGDQGIMYGYATNETESYLPEPVVKVHLIARKLQEKRRSGEMPYLRPDGKSQLTYENGKLKTILVSTQHAKDISQDELRQGIIEKILPEVFPGQDLSGVEILVNPTGSFAVGGFEADAGLTGRKIMVDTYCGLVPHGGGAFSGKDATKVDRSAAYYARYAAKNIVAHGLAEKAQVSVAYAIGKAEPLMVDVETFGTGDDEKAKKFLDENFDFRPKNIIEELGLRKPVFFDTASFGHFGDEKYSWEQIKKI